MAAGLTYWMDIVDDAVLVFLLGVVVVVVFVVFIYVCYLAVMAVWNLPCLRLPRLGGVTTLTERLNYTCTLCQHSMEAGEMVRTLSCDHTFHCGGGDKCENGIDRWLCTGPTAPCPICRQVPHPVPPSKQPPPTSPAPSPSASAPALQQLPRTSATMDLEEGLLPPAHDETLAEASSSASAPLLAQSPRTSTPGLEEVVPLLADDDILPEA